ncbi:isopenicillin-N N-acyltransferase-like protein [Bradyrhizobium sp. LM2.7]
MHIPILLLSGSARERGFTHGTKFKREIGEALARDFSTLAPAALTAAKRRAIKALDAIRAAAPDVADEIEGIAAGAKMPLQDVVLRVGFEFFRLDSGNGCSAVSLKSKEGAIVSQNWDAPVYKHAELALFVHFTTAGFEFATIASIGGLGWVGINRHGLALVNNDLMLEGYRDGIPSQVVRRIMLKMPDVHSAGEAILNIPHMGGRSYQLGDRAGNVGAIEVSAASGAHLFPAATVHLHTNNALLPATRTEESWEALQAVYPSSASRLIALENCFARESKDVLGVKRMLCDETGAPNAVCKTASAEEPTQTAFSVVMDCSRGEIHFASGKPTINNYRTITLPMHL